MLSAQRACLEQCIVQKLILYLRPLLAPILQETRRRTADRGSDLRLPQSNRWTRGRPPPAGSLPPSLARGGGGWRVPREGGRTDGRFGKEIFLHSFVPIVGEGGESSGCRAR